MATKKRPGPERGTEAYEEQMIEESQALGRMARDMLTTGFAAVARTMEHSIEARCQADVQRIGTAFVAAMAAWTELDGALTQTLDLADYEEAAE